MDDELHPPGEPIPPVEIGLLLQWKYVIAGFILPFYFAGMAALLGALCILAIPAGIIGWLILDPPRNPRVDPKSRAAWRLSFRRSWVSGFLAGCLAVYLGFFVVMLMT